MHKEIFKEYFEVRDNEIDIQGIVNNSNYMIYLAHARHKYAHKFGINFSEYAKNNQNFVVISCTLNFKQPLKPDDKFYVTCKVVPTDSAIRFAFEQEIRFEENNKLVLKAEFIATCVNGNAKSMSEKLYVPEGIKQLYENAVEGI